MDYNKRLVIESNKWGVLFLLTCLSALPFYLSETIKVPNLGDILFSKNLSEFNDHMEQAVGNIHNNLLYDFVFILAYTALFYVSYRVFVLSAKASLPGSYKFLCLIPGLFDVLENTLLCNLLANTDNAFVFRLFWLTVRAKFTFIIPFAVLNLTILIYYAISTYDLTIRRN